MGVQEAGVTEVSQLVARARMGDRAAFDGLVERYAPRLYNLTLRITGSREEAEDCVQEAFLKAFSSLRHFRGESAFSTWLYRVAVNVANDSNRRQQHRPLSSSELYATDDSSEEDPVMRTLPADSGDPAQEMARTERREVVLRALRALPEHHRTIIILSDLQGLSYEEIASVIGAKVGTVKSRLNRARLALKERLEPHMELLRS
jgi:RNA polymerase sigma-70 factor (ECF subfamily)